MDLIETAPTLFDVTDLAAFRMLICINNNVSSVQGSYWYTKWITAENMAKYSAGNRSLTTLANRIGRAGVEYPEMQHKLIQAYMIDMMTSVSDLTSVGSIWMTQEHHNEIRIVNTRYILYIEPRVLTNAALVKNCKGEVPEGEIDYMSLFCQRYKPDSTTTGPIIIADTGSGRRTKVQVS